MILQPIFIYLHSCTTCKVTGYVACDTRGQFQASTLQGLFEERYGKTSLGMVAQKQILPKASGEQMQGMLAAPATLCLKWQRDFLTTGSFSGALWWPSQAVFGPCLSTKGLLIRPCPGHVQLVRWGCSGLKGCIFWKKDLSENPPGETGLQNISSTENILQTVEGLKELNRRV